MPEITTRLGPLRLSWHIDYTATDGRIIEVFANLIGISDDTFWQRTKSEPQWRKADYDARWRGHWEDIEASLCKDIEASDAARAAIERERNDLRREDAERFAP